MERTNVTFTEAIKTTKNTEKRGENARNEKNRNGTEGICRRFGPFSFSGQELQNKKSVISYYKRNVKYSKFHKFFFSQFGEFINFWGSCRIS